jgi:hypothetical protein
VKNSVAKPLGMARVSAVGINQRKQTQITKIMTTTDSISINIDNGGRVYTNSYGGRTTWGFSLPDGSEGNGYDSMEAAEQAAAECMLPVDAE